MTTDQSLSYQQNLKDCRLAIVILPTTSWPKPENRVRELEATLAALEPGSVTRLPLVC